MSTPFSLDEYVRDLQTIVEMESHTQDAAGVNAVVDVLETRFHALGWHVTRSNVSGGQCGDVLELRNVAAEQVDVLLLGHTDTVYPRGTLQSFPFRVDGGRARGPGVADMKGGLLLMLALAR